MLGLLDVSNAEPLPDPLAQEFEQVAGVGLEIAEDLEPIAASRAAALQSLMRSRESVEIRTRNGLSPKRLEFLN